MTVKLKYNYKFTGDTELSTGFIQISQIRRASRVFKELKLLSESGLERLNYY